MFCCHFYCLRFPDRRRHLPLSRVFGAAHLIHAANNGTTPRRLLLLPLVEIDSAGWESTEHGAASADNDTFPQLILL